MTRTKWSVFEGEEDEPVILQMEFELSGKKVHCFRSMSRDEAMGLAIRLIESANGITGQTAH